MTDRDWNELAAAYALGALDEAEREAFEGRLADDPDLQGEVRSYEEVLGLVAEAHPSEPPPPELRTRLLERAGKVAPIGSARSGGDKADTPNTRPGPAILPWLAAAAALVLSFGLWNSLTGANRQLTQLQQELEETRQALTQETATLAERDALLGSFLGPMVHSVSLSSEPDAPPVARIYWNHDLERFVVTAFGLPPAPQGSTYQLWAIAEGQSPVSMGTFNTDQASSAATTLPVSQEITDLGLLSLCALTLEPDGGSPQPTETPRLVGDWRHTD